MSILEDALTDALHPSSYFEIYKDADDRWRWRLSDNSGTIVACSAEGYEDLRDCQHGIDLVKSCRSSPVR